MKKLLAFCTGVLIAAAMFVAAPAVYADLTLWYLDGTTLRPVDATWSVGVSGTAAGSDTQVQFNDGGTAFGGDTGLVFNKTTDTLTAVNVTVTGTCTGCSVGFGWPFTVGSGFVSTTTLMKLLGGASTTAFSANTAAIGQTGTTSISSTGAITAPSATFNGTVAMGTNNITSTGSISSAASPLQSLFSTWATTTNASTTAFSAQTASIGGSATTTLAADGSVTTGSTLTTPVIQLDTSATGVSIDTDGDGMLIIAGTGNGNDEDIRFNFDDGCAANCIAITSGTSADLLDWTGIQRSLFDRASTTRLSVLTQATFGSTATSSFDSAGVLSLATDLSVANGGTGASTLTDHGVLVGSGTSAIDALSVGTNGQLLVGSTGADPVFATLNCADNLTCTTGAGTLEIDLDTALTSITSIAVTNASTTNTSIATWLGIPNGTDPTITTNGVGTLAINETAASSSLRFDGGTSELALFVTKEMGFTIASTSAMNGTTTIPLGFAKRGETWVDSTCKVDTGAADIDFGDGTNLMGMQKLTSTAGNTTFASNNVFTFREAREVRIGSTTPNWNYLTCSFNVRPTAD